MNKPEKSMVPSLVERVRAFSANKLSGVQIIQALNGVHPIEIRAALLLAGEDDLLKSVFDNIAADLPRVHEIIREDNPVLSFWSFTAQSAAHLAKMAKGFKSVALLGTPTLYSVLRNQRACEVHLFERDDYLLREETAPSFHRCEVSTGIPKSFNNGFDLVIGDPPWYFDEYCAWLTTAERIVRPGGAVMFVLFPPGIRDTAPIEREHILGLAKKLFKDVRLSDVPVEYETPSFEQVQMIRSGVLPINWRRAALLVAHTKRDENDTQFSNRTISTEIWAERRVGSGRLFVNVAGLPASGEFLQEVQTGSRFLLSPSRRDPARSRANVVTSRGHGLRCSDPAELLRLIERLRDADDISSVSHSLMGTSQALFKSLAFDLWPRFICL